MSDALTRRLTAQRTLALRAALAMNPNAALAAAVHALIDAEFYQHDQTALDLAETDRGNVTGVEPGIAETTKAGQALAAQREVLAGALPASSADFLVWRSQQSIKVLLSYLAYCGAPSVNAVLQTAKTTTTYSGRSYAATHALAKLLGFNMAEWWQAGVATYFGAVSKAAIRSAVKEATGKAAPQIEKASKANAAEAAADIVGKSAWIPALIRG